jgi:hypothetical protein
MVRFSGEKARFVSLGFGIISIFGMRGDRILRILRGRVRVGGFCALSILPFLLFLETMTRAHFYGLRAMGQRQGPLWMSRTTRALVADDRLRYPVEEYLTHLRASGDEAVLEEMVHKASAVMGIERGQFGRIIRRRWAVASSVAWVVPNLMTITS